MSESTYHFDGTNIIFRFTILDASGLAPQAGITSTVITAYGSDRNVDAVTETVTEIGEGLYEASIPYADINRALADGLWSFVPDHPTNPDLTFDPPNITILINAIIGAVNNSVFTPTTTQAEFSGLSDTDTDHYIDAWVNVISDTNNNVNAVRQITASVLSNTRVKLTWSPALPSALANAATIKIINM